jgi:hypothetical protein
MRAEIAGLATKIRRSGGKPALVLAAAGALALGTGASRALADGYTLHLSAPAPAVVAQPIIIQATGGDPPPEQYWAAAWIEVVSIPTTVMTTCPASDQDGTAVATGTGGSVLAVSLRPNLDAAGNFSNLIGVTPTTPGSALICGYQDDGEGLTLASDSLTIDVLAAPPPPTPSPQPTPAPTPVPAPAPTPRGTTKPANVEHPHLARSGHALACKPGRWSNPVTSYAFGWLIDGKPKRGATGRQFAIIATLRGHKAQCTVTASNAAGHTTALSRPLQIH